MSGDEPAAGATLLDVAVAIDEVARAHGFNHLPDHGGHGIGRQMHEPPFMPNEPRPDAAQYRLRAGNTIAIEPMLHAGTSRYRTKKDGWSIATADGKWAAHVEHTVTVTVTVTDPETLTWRQQGKRDCPGIRTCCGTAAAACFGSIAEHDLGSRSRMTFRDRARSSSPARDASA